MWWYCNEIRQDSIKRAKETVYFYHRNEYIIIEWEMKTVRMTMECTRRSVPRKGEKKRRLYEERGYMKRKNRELDSC